MKKINFASELLSSKELIKIIESTIPENYYELKIIENKSKRSGIYQNIFEIVVIGIVGGAFSGLLKDYLKELLKKIIEKVKKEKVTKNIELKLEDSEGDVLIIEVNENSDIDKLISDKLELEEVKTILILKK